MAICGCFEFSRLWSKSIFINMYVKWGQSKNDLCILEIITRLKIYNKLYVKVKSSFNKLPTKFSYNWRDLIIKSSSLKKLFPRRLRMYVCSIRSNMGKCTGKNRYKIRPVFTATFLIKIDSFFTVTGKRVTFTLNHTRSIRTKAWQD